MTEDFQNIKLDTLPGINVKYLKSKIRKYGDKFYTNFRSLNVAENGEECKSFTVGSTDSVLVYISKFDLQIFLDNGVYKIVATR